MRQRLIRLADLSGSNENRNNTAMNISKGAKPMNCRNLLIVCSCFLLVACGKTVVEKEEEANAPQPTAQPLIIDQWDAQFIGEAKVGYTHTTGEAFVKDGETRLRYRAESELTLKRHNGITTQAFANESIERPDGELISFESRFLSGGVPTITKGVVVDDQLKIEVQTAGKTQASTLPWKKSYRGFFGAELELKRTPIKAGETRSVMMLMPVLLQMVRVEMIAQQPEPVFLLNKRQSLLRVESKFFLGEKVAMSNDGWVNEEGDFLKNHVPGVDQYGYRTTKAIAMAPSDTVNYDLGLQTTVKVTQPVEHPHETKKIRYLAKLKFNNPADVFASGGSQTVKPVDEHTAEITVKQLRPPFGDNRGNVPTQDDWSPNSAIQSDDPLVIKLANTWGGDEKDPWKLGLKLESAVHRGITLKDFSQAFATAADVAKDLQGDCTEHSVLLAALCRARGLPARVAMGLVYFPQQQGYAYHMWTEIYVENVWVPLDATLGKGGIGAAHLKIASSNLSGVGPLAAFLPVVKVLGQLELELLEVE